MVKLQYILSALLTVCACSSIKIPQEFQYREIPADDFTISSWQKISSAQAPFHIYIEGDGHSFTASGKVSSNPTPHDTTMRQLAFNDSAPNVVYLARPCQYIMNSNCQKKYWSTARFAPEIINSEYLALKSIAANRPITLVGFSGGAQIAGLLAVLHNDLSISKVITIAGNLDHPTWTQYHKVPALTQSLDLNKFKDKFASIPQHHFIGTDDNIVPPEITRNFIGKDILITTFSDTSHNRGWQKHSDQIYKIMP